MQADYKLEVPGKMYVGITKSSNIKFDSNFEYYIVSVVIKLTHVESIHVI